MAASEQELRFASALRTNPLIRAATIVLAASDARQQWATQADIVCSGASDDEALGTAINALPSLGGRIILSEGTFTLSTDISSAKNGVLIRGMGPGTVLTGGTVTLSGTNSDVADLTMGTYQSSGGGVSDPLVIGAVEATSYLAVGASPAASGAIRLSDGTDFIETYGGYDYTLLTAINGSLYLGDPVNQPTIYLNDGTLSPVNDVALSGVNLGAETKRFITLYTMTVRLWNQLQIERNNAGVVVLNAAGDGYVQAFLVNASNNLVLGEGNIQMPSLPSSNPGNNGMWVNAANHNAVTIGSGA